MADRECSATTRCAIYTRKSTDGGLDREFNSLVAQRESCEAYAFSQKALGWHVRPEQYNDGGYSRSVPLDASLP